MDWFQTYFKNQGDFKMSLKKLITVIYPSVRNILIFRVTKRCVAKFMEGYNNYKLQEQTRKSIKSFRLIHTCDKSSIVPYVNARIVCEALTIRGGQAEGIAFFLAMYRLMSVIEKYIRVTVPINLLAPIVWWSKKKKQHPWLEYLEDVLIALTSSSTLAIILRKDENTKFTFATQSSIEEFETFLGEMGVDSEKCDESLTGLFRVLIAKDGDAKIKLNVFRTFVDSVIDAENSGSQQGYVLCLCALLIFIFILNPSIGVSLLTELFALYKSGRISKGLYRLLLRRLRKRGIPIPEDLDV